MKKILSLALAVMMLVSAVPMVNAAENETDYTNGTAITLNGSGEEYYTVTVPATMSPGDTATVRAEGTWAADKFLNVGAPSTVTLTYGAQTMDVAITFQPEGSNVNGGFSLIGNSIETVSKEVEISVEDASRLFGTWEGILEYQVDLIHKGDVNRDGMITQDDADMIQQGTLGNELTAEQQQYADIDGNGNVNIVDAVKIQLAVAGAYVNGAINGTAATE